MDQLRIWDLKSNKGSIWALTFVMQNFLLLKKHAQSYYKIEGYKSNDGQDNINDEEDEILNSKLD